jgi:plastocyanin
MKRSAPLLLASLALLAAGCGSSNDTNTTPSAPASGNGPKVDMKNIAFDPKTTTVKVGQTVTWTNQDDVEHNVVATKGATFESSTFGKGGTYRYKATKPGTIQYTCTLHPGMDATLTVTS